VPRPLRLLTSLLAGGVLVAGLAVPAAADEDTGDGPVVGMPPIEDAVVGWVDNWADPDFWTSYVRGAIEQGHVNLPYPFDPVKPEIYLPNVPVAAGDEPSALPVDLQDLSELTYEWRGEAKTIDQFVTTTRTDGIVLVVDGTVVGEWYANGYARDVRHQPWSVTKTVVAAAVGVAFDEGLIGSLDEPIERSIDDLVGTAWEGVTIEQLLRMESGVHWDEDTPVLAVNTQVEQWIDLALDLYSEGALGATRNGFLAGLPAAYEPGTEFRYNSGNTQVLAWLTEVLYDAPFHEVLAETIWKPMGAEASAVMTADRVGGVVASHGLFALPFDLARFGELLRNEGRTPEGRQVVSAEWVAAMIEMSDVSEGRYGYQTWAHPTAGDGAYSASGFQGQKVTVVPDACVTGVRLSHALGATVRDGELTDPDAYGFGTEFFSEEWQTLLAAVAEEVGTCDSTAGGQPVASEDEQDGERGRDGAADATPDGGAGSSATPASTSLPMTGGGPLLLGAVLLAVTVGVRRR
jgi:CubicO group peptidase (beta-lactamase class C family)